MHDNQTSNMSKERPNSEPLVKVLAKQNAPGQAENLRQRGRTKAKKARDDIVKIQMRWHKDLKTPIMGGTSMSIPLPSITLPPPYLPSVAPIEELKKICIEDLRLGTHHRGSYSLLRAITPYIRTASLTTVLEDEKEDAVTSHFYQHGDEELQPAADIISEGMVCIIKEPWYKLMADGSYGLRVDHISDVMWLPEVDARMPLKWQPQPDDIAKTAIQLKENDNDALKLGKLHEAIKW